MAITTYAELQTAVASWLHRDVDQIVDFITMAEKRINSLLDSRVGEVDASLTATPSSRYITLPTGYIRPLQLWCTYYDPRREVLYVTPQDLITSTSESYPTQYTINGASIEFNYPPDIAYTYTLKYKKHYDIAITSTNDILTNYPQIYLYGALVEACLLTREDPSRFEERFQLALDEAIKSESKNYSNAKIISESSILGYPELNILSNGD